MDVVFVNGWVCRFQRQQVLVPRFDRLQLVLGVLGLTLMRELEAKMRNRQQQSERDGVNLMSEDLPFDKWLCFHVSARTASHSAGTRLLSKQNILGNVRDKLQSGMKRTKYGKKTKKWTKTRLWPWFQLGHLSVGQKFLTYTSSSADKHEAVSQHALTTALGSDSHTPDHPYFKTSQKHSWKTCVIKKSVAWTLIICHRDLTDNRPVLRKQSLGESFFFNTEQLFFSLLWCNYWLLLPLTPGSLPSLSSSQFSSQSCASGIFPPFECWRQDQPCQSAFLLASQPPSACSQRWCSPSGTCDTSSSPGQEGKGIVLFQDQKKQKRQQPLGVGLVPVGSKIRIIHRLNRDLTRK